MGKCIGVVVIAAGVFMLGLPATIQCAVATGDKLERGLHTTIELPGSNGKSPSGSLSRREITADHLLHRLEDTDQGRGAGGPDSYGYKWLDSDTLGGPAYSWIEIGGIGTRVQDIEWQSVQNPLDDGTAGPFSIGFSFFYERAMFDHMYIGTNGVLSFTCEDLTYDGYFYEDWYFPDLAVPGLWIPDAIVPFWADFNLDTTINGGGDVYYWSNNADSFIVEFHDIKPWTAEPTIDAVTFQIILSGLDSSMTFQYQDVETPHAPVSWDSTALIGIQDQTTRLGLGYFSGVAGPLENLPHANLAVRFQKVMTHTHNIALGNFCPPSVSGVIPEEQFAESYETIWPWALVVNTGEFTETAVPVLLEVDSSGHTVYSDFVTGSADPLQADTVDFSPFTPTHGAYELCYHADLPDDVFPEDDTGRVIIYAQRTSFISPQRSTIPIIDGIIEADEWSDAAKIDISRIGDLTPFPWVLGPPPYQSPGTAFMYAKHDPHYLFLGFDILTDTTDSRSDYIHLYLDDNGDGQWNTDSSEGCLYLRNRLADTTDAIDFLSFFPPPQFWADTVFTVDDVERGFGHSSGHQQAEIRIPFGTDELWHLDTSLSDTSGVFLMYRDWSDSIYIPEEDYWAHRGLGLWPIDGYHFQLGTFGQVFIVIDPENRVEEQRFNGDGCVFGIDVLPNPSSGGMLIRYELPKACRVRVAIFNMLGQSVGMPLDAEQDAGAHRLIWDCRDNTGREVPSGTYFLRLQAGDHTATRKLSVMR